MRDIEPTEAHGANIHSNYTARSDEPGHVLVRMPGSEYGMPSIQARLLVQQIERAIKVAEFICEDCGEKDESVEAMKFSDTEPATPLCDDCFNARDQG